MTFTKNIEELRVVHASVSVLCLDDKVQYYFKVLEGEVL